MSEYNIYADIAARTGGDIYIGVVGPVRTGKSTFIRRFMEELVLPGIADDVKRERARDELPQSSTGKTIMTTEPKFVPNEAVTVAAGNGEANVRLIDCVGFMAEGALGAVEDDRPRMVGTPWSDEKMPFERAAELGTEKVIKDHSTIAVVVTSDGSFTDIDRAGYAEAEARVISELKASGKPFAVVVNSARPDGEEAMSVAAAISENFGVKAVAMSVPDATEKDFRELLTNILLEFPIKRIDIKLPLWMFALGIDHPAVKGVVDELYASGGKVRKMGDYSAAAELFEDSEYLESSPDVLADPATGLITLEFRAKDGVFYKVLSDKCGEDVSDDLKLMRYVIKAAGGYSAYKKISAAMDSVRDSGYGVVTPTLADMTIAAPELMKKGTQYGIKLKATAPSVHMIRVDVETEVSPMIGSEQQSADLVEHLIELYRTDPNALWETNMLGKPLSALVEDDLKGKTGGMPEAVQIKLRRALKRVVNEGKGGILCILI